MYAHVFQVKIQIDSVSSAYKQNMPIQITVYNH